MKRLSLVAIFCTLLLNTYAQKVWTLEACISHALQNNLSLRSSRLLAENQQLTLKQSQMNRLPSISANSNWSNNYGRSIDPFTNTFLNQAITSNNFQLQGTVNLFSGFAVQNTIRQNAVEVESGKHSFKVNENDLMLAVANAYLQILLATELQQAAQAQLELSSTQSDRSQKLFEAGRIAEADLMQQEAQKANDELSLVTAKNNVQLLYLSLWQLLDVNPDLINTIESPGNLRPMRSGPANADEIFNKTNSERPEILFAEGKVKSAGYGLKVAEAQLYPKLFLFGNVSSLYSSTRKDILGYNIIGIDPSGIILKTGDTVYSPRYSYDTKTTPYWKQVNNNFGKSCGLSLQIPLLNGWQTQTQIARAKITIQQANINLQIAKLSLYKNITQACADLNASQKKLQATNNNFQAADKSFKFAKIRYDNGAISYTDFQLTAANRSRAEAQLIQSRYELIFREKVIDFYEGGVIR
ncbi:MAG: TolC family protein [Flavobacteriaceae bacterium]|nr:TolC family protein [Flavobacteriaceae bacterium]